MDFQKDLAKIKAALAKRTSTEEGYRGLVALVLFLAGSFGVIGKLSTRLDEARVLHEEISTTATLVSDIRHFEGQSKFYSARMTPPDDKAEWGQYILDTMEDSESNMVSFHPQKTNPVGNYKLLKFEVLATGEYFQLVDFMDRLEKGERFIRIDEFEIAPAQGTLQIRCIILCLAGVTYEQARARQAFGAPIEEPSLENDEGDISDESEESVAEVDPPLSGDAS